MKALLIAEKPSLRKTLEEVYNKHKSEIPYNITFMEQRGHLLTLKLPSELDEDLEKWSWDTLPIHPEEHGGWQYKIIPEEKKGSFLTAKERYMAIRDELLSGDYDFIINAGDPDQEGELLIRIVLTALKNKLPVKRYWSNDLTEARVLDALLNLRDDDKDPMLIHLLHAAYGRQHADYRFGMNLSRAATLKMGARVSCGRVKTPILAIVCKRENEINNFVPSTCYGVRAEYSEGFSGQLFDKSITAEDTDESAKKDASAGLIWFDTKKEADDFISKLGSTAKVVSYETKKTKTLPPKLFALADVQIAAGKLGYRADRVLEILQSLYEKKFLSYPRTDCEYVSSTENFSTLLKSAASIPELIPFVKRISVSDISRVKSNNRWINDEKLKESGHSALIPTENAPDFSSLSEDEQVIYTLVCRQFVAIFLPPLIQDKTVMITEISGKTFKSNGKTLIDAGYTEIFKTKFCDMIIKPHSTGDTLTVTGYSTVDKTTTCPKRFTDGDLIAACEKPHKYLNDASFKTMGDKLKIGTPATRAPIIQELINNDKYLRRVTEKKTEYIVPSESGMIIYENLKNCDICKVDLTAAWEQKLEMVRIGKTSLEEFEDGMKKHIERLLEDIKSAPMTSLKSERKIIGKCPDPACGGDIISGTKSFYCSNYKTKGCNIGAFKGICDSTITDDEFVTLLGGKNITKTIKKGTTKWSQELTYDIKSRKIQFVVAEKKASSYSCPKCEKQLTDNGRVLKCDCGFSLWKTVGADNKALTKEQLDNFFETGDTGLIKNIKSKKGSTYNAHIKLKEDKSGTEYVYDN